MFELRLLGGLEISATDGRSVVPLQRRSKRMGLLAYLGAALPHGFHRRDKLLALFWPEADETRARAALSQALYVLRNELGEQAILTRGESEVALGVEAVWCDVAAFEMALDQGRPVKALGLYRGDLLDGFFVTGAPEFQRWVDGERTRLRQRAAEGAWMLAEAQAAAGAAVDASRWAWRAGELLPDDEAVTRRLMTFLDRQGDKAAAIRAYEAFAQRLRREHELDPSEETQALAATIRSHASLALQARSGEPLVGSPRPTRDAPRTASVSASVQTVAESAIRAGRTPQDRGRDLLAGTRRRVMVVGGALVLGGLLYAAITRMTDPSAAGAALTAIAVLPPANRTGDPDEQNFVDAMHDALVTELAQIGGLTVLSRQSVLRYRQTDKSVPEIAAELGVDAIVNTAVARAGDTVQVTAQLVQARPAERTLWAQTFRRDFHDVLALHGDVARSIAERVNVAVTPDELRRLGRDRSVEPAAYQAWLSGWVSVMHRLAGPELRRCIAHADTAVAIDPSYAQAYALAAGCYLNLTYFTPTAPQDAFPKAKVAAQRAMDIDPSLGSAHMALALVLWAHEWDWSGADRAFRQAVELAPSDGLAHAMYGFSLASMARHDEAVEHARRAELLSPGVPVERQNLAMVLYLARRYDEAIVQAQRTIDLAPEFGFAYARLALAYEGKEMYEQAIIAWEGAVALMGDTRSRASLARAYGLVGRREEALHILTELLTLQETSYVPPTAIARIYLGLNQLDEAIFWLEKGYDGRDGDMVLLKTWPALDPLRPDPRFLRLLERMRFPDG